MIYEIRFYLDLILSIFRLQIIFLHLHIFLLQKDFKNALQT